MWAAQSGGRRQLNDLSDVIFDTANFRFFTYRSYTTINY